MAKGKLAKFADMDKYPNVFQCSFDKNRTEEEWANIKEEFHKSLPFKDNLSAPLVIELGCGKGEYTVGLAKMFPDINFIGVDIKGARMWTGATQAVQEGLPNVAFLRTNIEIIDRFFYQDEVSEIWITFADPQMKKVSKRLTSTAFLERYRKILKGNGLVHLKTDSNFLFTYTEYMAEHNNLPVLVKTRNLYSEPSVKGDYISTAAAIQTYYESQWLARGLDIKYMLMQLPHDGILAESEKEIPLDDYRSYHRDKRSPKETTV